MDGLYIPVHVEQLAKDCEASERRREIIGTVYFKEGTPASEVVRYIMKRQKTSSGIWLIQMKVTDPEKYESVEDKCYVNIRDSTHTITEENKYSAMYYNGPNMFII